MPFNTSDTPPYYSIHTLNEYKDIQSFCLFLDLLPCLRSRLTIQPKHNKAQKSTNYTPQSTYPWPSSTDTPAPWPFIMRKMPHCDLTSFFNICEEWAFVIDLEGKDAMLVWRHKCCTVYGCIRRCRGRCEVKSMERR